MQQIKPKQLILVHGLPESTRHLAEYCRNTPGCVQGRVFTPKLGEIVDATIESHIFQVTLTDVLMSSLQFQPVKDAELAWVDARVLMRKNTAVADAASAMLKVKPMLEEEKNSNETSPVLHVLPQNSIPTHTAVFVNDPKLSDLKQLLMVAGFQAEFSSGVLYVNNAVAIRRNEAGKLHVEGCACEEYYRIRDMIYKQYAIV